MKKPNRKGSTTPADIQAAAARQLSEVLKRLQEKLRELGFTQIQVATELGWKPGRLTSILGGKIALRVDHLFAICELIDVPPGELLGLQLYTRVDEALTQLLRTYAHPSGTLGEIPEEDLLAAAEEKVKRARGRNRQYLKDVIQWCKASKEADARAARRREGKESMRSSPKTVFPDFGKYKKPVKKPSRKSKSARCGSKEVAK
ncbi:MAG: helix-turn-helix transcriptional regulator [bacterium]|nr:helix-turn-helix transcriptional regulator [bacterium]